MTGLQLNKSQVNTLPKKPQSQVNTPIQKKPQLKKSQAPVTTIIQPQVNTPPQNKSQPPVPTVAIQQTKKQNKSQPSVPTVAIQQTKKQNKSQAPVTTIIQPQVNTPIQKKPQLKKSQAPVTTIIQPQVNTPPQNKSQPPVPTVAIQQKKSQAPKKPQQNKSQAPKKPQQVTQKKQQKIVDAATKQLDEMISELSKLEATAFIPVKPQMSAWISGLFPAKWNGITGYILGYEKPNLLPPEEQAKFEKSIDEILIKYPLASKMLTEDGLQLSRNDHITHAVDYLLKKIIENKVISVVQQIIPPLPPSPTPTSTPTPAPTPAPTPTPTPTSTPAPAPL